jgi:hypothetical protein
VRHFVVLRRPQRRHRHSKDSESFAAAENAHGADCGPVQVRAFSADTIFETIQTHLRRNLSAFIQCQYRTCFLAKYAIGTQLCAFLRSCFEIFSFSKPNLTEVCVHCKAAF